MSEIGPLLPTRTDKEDALFALLQQTRALPPIGFALRTTGRFQSEVAAKHLRRVALLCAAAFAAASATIWILLLNFQDAAASARHGLSTTISLIGSVLTIWDNLPLSCGMLSIVMSAMLLLTGGLLLKLTQVNSFVK